MNVTVRCLRHLTLTPLRASIRGRCALSNSPLVVTFDDGHLSFHHGTSKYIVSYWTPMDHLARLMSAGDPVYPLQIENSAGEDVTSTIEVSAPLGKVLSEALRIKISTPTPATLSMTSDTMIKCIGWHQMQQKPRAIRDTDRQQLLSQYEPLVNEFMSLVAQAESTASNKFKWGGLFLLSAQLGFFARLIWIDYSWDVMEPITWCVTYSMMVATFAYYIVASQEFMLPLAEKRAVQIKLSKLIQAAQNSGQFDLRTFRRLRKKLLAIEASKSSHNSTAFDTLLKSGITG